MGGMIAADGKTQQCSTTGKSYHLQYYFRARIGTARLLREIVLFFIVSVYQTR